MLSCLGGLMENPFAFILATKKRFVVRGIALGFDFLGPSTRSRENYLEMIFVLVDAQVKHNIVLCEVWLGSSIFYFGPGLQGYLVISTACHVK